MMADCKKCEREKSIKLVGGKACCSMCKWYMLECEARHLLKLGLNDSDMRRLLAEREKLGRDVEGLKLIMAQIFEANKN